MILTFFTSKFEKMHPANETPLPKIKYGIAMVCLLIISVFCRVTRQIYSKVHSSIICIDFIIGLFSQQIINFFLGPPSLFA